MPLYSYICEYCGTKLDIFRPMCECTNPWKCTGCGRQMRRDYTTGFNAVGENYSKPLHSDSLAISPDQIAEHKKHFPDVEIDSHNRPVFTNYRQHQNYLDKTGFVKLPQKTKVKGKKIKSCN